MRLKGKVVKAEVEKGGGRRIEEWWKMDERVSDVKKKLKKRKKNG